MLMNLAHRGASSYAPENTLAAFYLGASMGANGLETDLRMTKDGVPILLHDPTLDRTTNGKGRPGDYHWSELRRLDAGSWFSDAYKGEKLVAFEDFLYYFGAKDLMLAVELKEPHLEDAALELLRRYGALEKTTITSFAFELLVETRKRHATVKLGFLTEKITPETVARLLEHGIGQICPRARTLRSEDVRYAKERGLQVRAWGVPDESVMKHALACGVDGMTVNFPDLLAQAAAP